MTNETPVPLLLRNAHLRSVASETLHVDSPTAEDPLPTFVDVDANAYVVMKETRITCIQTETTDDY